MHIDLLKKRYAIDAIDLPNQHGMPNVVQMYSLDSEEYQALENGRRVTQTRHNLWLLGCRLPLRLNNTRVDVIASMYGTDTDAWQGKKIVLHTGSVSAYGQTKLGILILPQAPPADAALTPWPDRLRTVQAGYTGPSLPPQAPAPQLPPSTPGQAAEMQRPIGGDSAMDLLCACYRRGKDAAWVVATLAPLGCKLDHLLPPEYPALALRLIKPHLAGIPATKPPPSPQQQGAWRASWAPKPAADEVVDPQTGEVKPAAPAEPNPDDDIPF